VDNIYSPLLRSINPSSSNWVFHQVIFSFLHGIDIHDKVDSYDKYESEVKHMSQLAEKLSSIDSAKHVTQFNVISSLPQKVILLKMHELIS
jgi:hypothetical protein